jgi:hypothetical protein
VTVPVNRVRFLTHRTSVFFAHLTASPFWFQPIPQKAALIISHHDFNLFSSLFFFDNNESTNHIVDAMIVNKAIDVIRSGLIDLVNNQIINTKKNTTMNFNIIFISLNCRVLV